MKRERYRALLEELGTLAFERFGRLPSPPPTFAEVDACFAESDRLAHEIGSFEAALNAEDEAHRAWLEHEKSERARLKPLLDQWRSAIDGAKAHSEHLRRDVRVLSGALERDRHVLQSVEAKHRDAELRHPDDVDRLTQLKEDVVKLRLRVLRETHQLEDARVDLRRALEPQPGQKGGPGVRAYGEWLELDLERVRRKHEHADTQRRFEHEIAWRERRLSELDAQSKDAVIALGEECYTERVPDPAFLELVERLDALRAG